MTDDVVSPDNEEWDIAAARAKLAPKYDGRKAARKSRQRRLADSVDGRSLRATGRTEHLNFKARPQTRAKIDEAAAFLGVPKSLWLEQIIEAAHRELFKENDA